MKMLIMFDTDGDIVDVPEFVVQDRDSYRNRFWKWLSNPSIRHGYWVTVKDCYGGQFMGLRYRGDAFVKWLNKKVLAKSDDKALMVEAHVDISQYKDSLPFIFF